MCQILEETIFGLSIYWYTCDHYVKNSEIGGFWYCDVRNANQSNNLRKTRFWYRSDSSQWPAMEFESLEKWIQSDDQKEEFNDSQWINRGRNEATLPEALNPVQSIWVAPSLKKGFRFSSIRRSNRRNRLAISEVIATIVLIAVTLVIGSVVWIWASSSAVTAENNIYANSSEKFAIVASGFSMPYSGTPPSTTGVSIWIFNSEENTNVTILVNSTCVPSTCTSRFLPHGILTEIPLTLTVSHFDEGSLQTIKAVGQYGSVSSYQVVS